MKEILNMSDSDILKTLQVLEKTHGNSKEVVYSAHLSDECVYLFSDIGYAGNNPTPRHEWRMNKADPDLEIKLKSAVQLILGEAQVA